MYWSAAPQVAGLATLVRLWPQKSLPPTLTVNIQNVLLVLAAGLFLAGICQFFGKPLKRRFLLSLVVVSIVCLWFFTGYEGAVLHRRLFVRSVLILLYAYSAWVVYRQPHTFARWLTIITVCVLISIIILRTVLGLLWPQGDGIDSQNIAQALYSFGLSTMVVFTPVCAILMTSERLRFVLEDLAMKDSLTGVLTRRAVFELGENELAGCQRRGLPFSVLMLDLDHFKEINDTYGHDIGDRVLQDFTERARNILRSPFAMGRYGGEEFVVILPGTDSDDAAAVAERIRSTLNANSSRPEIPKYCVSIGVASAFRGSRESLIALIKSADQGLYQAKQRGRNRVETIGPRMTMPS